MVPFEVPVKGLVTANVRHPTARLSHGGQGGLVQLSSLLQPKLPLHPLQSLGGGHHGLKATAVQCVHVAKLLQVTLEDNMSKHYN